MPDLPPEFIAFLQSITGKRPRIVIDHILEHGYIITEELRALYGYNHPPRAARDVREQGVPLVTFRVTGSDGRQIAAYKFGDPADVDHDKLGGRTAIPKSFKDSLLEQYDQRCAICLETYDSQYLQVDHRIPYEISGEENTETRDLSVYMLVCRSCNRAKAWTCEHCPNTDTRNLEICQTCYWAYPENYSHIATRPIRRIELVWADHEISDFDALKLQAAMNDELLPAYIKAILARHLRQNDAE
ncbi:MAG: HNH endonuclease [Anaerolineae bacterium]|nr:HNH endonuclease [Anaerolineae bacterium]